MDHRNETREETLIRLLREGMERHPRQRNDVFASDAELVELDGRTHLACTVDCLREEIDLGIIEDPFLIGWVSVVISLSDLAAVGADPLGLLLAWTIPPDTPPASVAAVARGANDAVRHHETYILGGDCNPGHPLQITATALGTVPGGSAVQRVGMRPGDKLYLTGRVGLGNALGLAKLRHLPEAHQIEQSFRPVARFEWRSLLREFASSCIDTSDGVLASLDILSRLNRCGVEFWNLPSMYSEEVNVLSSHYHIFRWLFAAAELGEYELLFSVPSEREAEFLARCNREGLTCWGIGRATAEQEIRLVTSGSAARLDVPVIRGFAESLMKDPKYYVSSLIEYSNSVGISERAFA